MCFNREVQQYHLKGQCNFDTNCQNPKKYFFEPPDEAISGKQIEGDVISLGFFTNNVPVESSEDEKPKKRQKYLAQNYEEGSLCELSSKLRKTEVRVRGLLYISRFSFNCSSFFGSVKLIIE